MLYNLYLKVFVGFLTGSPAVAGVADVLCTTH